MIGGFRSVLCLSVFQGSLLVIVIMIDGREKRNCEGGFQNFRVRMFVKSAVKVDSKTPSSFSLPFVDLCTVKR